MTDKIVVAMSGGVDSGVSALILKEQGHDLVGISMQVWDYRQNGGCSTKATCCSPDDFTDARVVADKIDIPYYVFDFEKTFRKKVIDDFVNKYQQGLTPNPCIECNNKVKFKELRNRADKLNCPIVATGHYAQIEKDEQGYHLIRGVDSNKDQSYFLYGLLQNELANTLFPVGAMTKPEVRELAKSYGLSIATKPESQDICFVSGSVKDFIVKIGGKGKSGNMINAKGDILGTHDGIHSFTVGQRRGLGISTENPNYVLDINTETNNIVVGEKKELEKEGYLVREVNWIRPDILKLNQEGIYPIKFNAIAQVRYGHEGVPVEVEIVEKDLVKVKFTKGWATVSPGQASVFYCMDNKEVIGGGKIVKS